MTKTPAPRNRTLTLTQEEQQYFATHLRTISEPVKLEDVLNATICQNAAEVIPNLPDDSVDLLFLDPPYNLKKVFNNLTFSELALGDYEVWLENWVVQLTRLLKSTASVYVCSDWRSSAAVHRVLERHFIIRNRITWEREKGRGAKANWKNCLEDIWFCTASDDYVFNVEDVKLQKRVIAPYKDDAGRPKDWIEQEDGRFRQTYPSNLWTDLTVPFWSMPENTDHPTQKPEKLLARVILASSNEGDVILDPFLGSGTTSVVAKKLRRNYIGIEIDETYCCYAEKRLQLAEQDASVQGYADGFFWERNTFSQQPRSNGSGNQQ